MQESFAMHKSGIHSSDKVLATLQEIVQHLRAPGKLLKVPIRQHGSW